MVLAAGAGRALVRQGVSAIGRSLFSQAKMGAANFAMNNKEQLMRAALMGGKRAVSAISKGVGVNKTHRANRRFCKMSKKEYRDKGGYLSRTPLCLRECYKKYGRCYQ